jgi:hypothetical protein
MEIRFNRADVVILASAHNPSILSPQWLKEKELIAEKPENFINTPDFSLFESQAFSLIVDRQRLQINTKKQDLGTIESLKRIGAGYLRLLPHIPYLAIGLNLVWILEKNAEEELPKINIEIGRAGNLSGILSDHKLSYGCIINAIKQPYILKLNVEPQGNNIIIYSFNYHHETKGISVDELIKYVENLTELYKSSYKIVKDIVSAGETK